MSTYADGKRGKELVQIIYKINVIYPWTYKGGECHPPLFLVFFLEDQTPAPVFLEAGRLSLAYILRHVLGMISFYGYEISCHK